VALVEIEARLLPLRKVDKKPKAVLLDDDGAGWLLAPEQAILHFQPFELANTLLSSQTDAERLEQFDEDIRKHLLAVRHRQRGDLHVEPVAIAIHSQTGKSIALAEHQPIGLVGAIESQNITPQSQGGLDLPVEEGAIEWNVRLPAIKAN